MISWGVIDKLINKAKSLDYKEGLAVVFDLQTTKIEIVRLNTEEQLFEGINSDGNLLDDIGGAYRPFTIAKKQEKNQPFDRVTLFDTGELYDSYRVPRVTLDGFVIEANTIKEGDDLEDRYGKLEGLTEESEDVLVKFISPDYAKWLIEEFKNV